MDFCLALVPSAYIAGSIPTGVLLARRSGIDVRAQGSGNIGATNVARTAGKKLGLYTLLGDLAKGLLPVLLARWLSCSETVVSVVALAAVAGHVFSCFLGFRGGKGVATGLGVLCGLEPWAALIPVAAFGAAFLARRIVSLASIVAVLTAPFALAMIGGTTPAIMTSAAIALLITAKHRENVVRLARGTEPQFSWGVRAK